MLRDSTAPKAVRNPTCRTRISKQTSLRAVLRAPRYFGLAHAVLRHNEFVDELLESFEIDQFGHRKHQLRCFSYQHKIIFVHKIKLTLLIMNKLLHISNDKKIYLK